MPVIPEHDLLDLLRHGAISALTIDANIFDEKGLQLRATPLASVAILKNRAFTFLLSGTVANEVRGHIEKRADEALRAARKAIGEALYAFETHQPTRTISREGRHPPMRHNPDSHDMSTTADAKFWRMRSW